jgi:hypothetical protein
MTDARWPDRWLSDRRLLRLPPEVFRTFATGLLWSVANKTDGVLDDDDLPLIPLAGPGHCEQLAAAGLWERLPGGWLIREYRDTQTSRTELDALAERRAADRERKARERLRKALSRDSPVTSHGDVPESHGDVPKARQGKARTGRTGGGVLDPWAAGPGPGSASFNGSPAPAGKRTA